MTPELPTLRSAEDLRQRYREMLARGEVLTFTEDQYVKRNLPHVRRNLRERLQQGIGSK